MTAVSDNSENFWMETARKYFPDASDETLEFIIYNYTGFPAFFDTSNGDTIEECFVKHLLEYKEYVAISIWYNETNPSTTKLPYYEDILIDITGENEKQYNILKKLYYEQKESEKTINE